MNYKIDFQNAGTVYHFENDLNVFHDLLQEEHVIVLTDQHVFEGHKNLFTAYKTFVIPAGEDSKSLTEMESIIQELLLLNADRNSFLLGVGGGVVTDITGFVASVFMRGVRFGFVPTSLLGMVDAAIGGKNGVNTGLYKNMIGTISQPEFIFFHSHFLQTLQDAEWSNGFAEIIKYAFIFDTELIQELRSHDLSFYQENEKALMDLVMKCVDWKNKTVLEDEYEKGIRKLLNFGHTAGHAIEKHCNIPHGQAVAVGMVIACMISENENGLSKNIRTELVEILTQYGLPHCIAFDLPEVMDILKMDKKRKDGNIDYIVLQEAGKAVVKNISLETIGETLKQFQDEYHC